MKYNNEYIKECLSDNKYIIILNGKEVKRMPFYKEAIRYAEKYNGEDLFSFNLCEVVDMQTGERIYPIY